MIRLYPKEEFREIPVDYPLQFRYAVSNRGRLISFTDDFQDGRLLNGGRSSGYKTFRYTMKKGKKTIHKTVFIYKLVAELFLPKTAEDQNYVIHLDHTRDNDLVQNLRWVNWADKLKHRDTNPNVQGIGEKVRAYRIQADGRKLTSTKVIRLKKMLLDPERKTRIKILAKQFGISEMQVSRIKSGENWGHIKVS